MCCPDRWYPIRRCSIHIRNARTNARRIGPPLHRLSLPRVVALVAVAGLDGLPRTTVFPHRCGEREPCEHSLEIVVVIIVVIICC
jgi:hypothetical protein